MILKLESYEKMLDCYAFQGLPADLTDKFAAKAFDVDYYSDEELNFTEDEERKIEESREQWLMEQMKGSHNEKYYRIAMAEQDKCLEYWLNHKMKENGHERYGYLAVAEWETSHENRVRDYYGLWKNLIRGEQKNYFYNWFEGKITAGDEAAFWGVAEFRTEDIAKTVKFSSGKNAVLLVSNHRKDKLEDFPMLYHVRKEYVEIDEQKVFKWIDREDGMYVKYSTDGEGELVSIFEKK